MKFNRWSRPVTCAVVAGLVWVSTPALAQDFSTEGTIYDPRLMERMTFSEAQLPKVEQILQQSEQAMQKVFAKHRIDPRAKPDFDRLYGARQELQAIEEWEKKAMKRILSKQQYADYLVILQATTALVIKATRND